MKIVLWPQISLVNNVLYKIEWTVWSYEWENKWFPTTSEKQKVKYFHNKNDAIVFYKEQQWYFKKDFSQFWNHKKCDFINKQLSEEKLVEIGKKYKQFTGDDFYTGEEIFSTLLEKEEKEKREKEKREEEEREEGEKRVICSIILLLVIFAAVCGISLVNSECEEKYSDFPGECV